SDPLVMMALDRESLSARRPGRERAGSEPDLVLGPLAGGGSVTMVPEGGGRDLWLGRLAGSRSVTMVPEALRQMLVQRSTVGYVHDLHPSADPQQRDPALHRPDREPQLHQ